MINCNEIDEENMANILNLFEFSFTTSIFDFEGN